MPKRRKTGTQKSEGRMLRCGTMEKHALRAASDPEYVVRRRQIEAAAQQWLRGAARGIGGRGEIVRIPVVVHVVYNTATENISNAQIQSQITILNDDYRLLNSLAGVPSVFSSLAADTRIEFALAVRDPNCASTTGITRTYTSVTSWADFSDAMKAGATGGIDPWDTSRYLNVWVIADGGLYLGWGEFPGAPTNVDGVVIRHPFFGNTGTVTSTAFGGGRTATHEVGHWLDLLHIWGVAGCGTEDGITDTPNQDDENFGCPTHPNESCMNGGDMFMNYMDYTDDGCMALFTVGQRDRMHATLAVSRSGILASDGLVPPPVGGTGTTDLWIADTADDIGAEPNASPDVMWTSPDIWVRNQDDGVANQQHQNPEYRPAGGLTSFVYVRVRNRACTGSGSATLKLYYAKASSALSWPAPWDGSVTTPALMGGFIGQMPTTVGGRTTQIVKFAWNPPNPADYASFGADQGHFCLLARLETSSTAPFGMATPETTDLNANVRNNNNIAWKNITVVDEIAGGGRFGSMIIGTLNGKAARLSLVFTTQDPRRRDLFSWGDVVVRMPDDVYKRWKTAGAPGENIGSFPHDGILLRGRDSTIDNVVIKPNETVSIELQFVPRRSRPRLSALYRLDVAQRINKRIVGGVRFDIPVAAAEPARLGCEPVLIWDGVTWVKRTDDRRSV